jgi:hypothetical protein
MALPSSGQIAASQINTELGRSASAGISIYAARNGLYVAINEASGKRPTANGQSGYAWSHWYSYNHSAAYPIIYVYENEPTADTNMRFYANDNYGNRYLSDFWYFYNTSGTNVATDSGTTIRVNDEIGVSWIWFGWGDPNTYTYKRVYSYSRGFLFIGDGPTSTQVDTVFYPQSGESLECQAFNY